MDVELLRCSYNVLPRLIGDDALNGRPRHSKLQRQCWLGPATCALAINGSYKRYLFSGQSRGALSLSKCLSPLGISVQTIIRLGALKEMLGVYAGLAVAFVQSAHPLTKFAPERLRQNEAMEVESSALPSAGRIPRRTTWPCPIDAAVRSLCGVALNLVLKRFVHGHLSWPMCVSVMQPVTGPAQTMRFMSAFRMACRGAHKQRLYITVSLGG